MLQVKVFAPVDGDDLEFMINQWLFENWDDISIKTIRQSGGSVGSLVTIWYEDEEPVNVGAGGNITLVAGEGKKVYL